MPVSAARRPLWRGMHTAAAAATATATDSTLLARLVAEPECRVKATMEEASSSTPRREAAFWEPLAAALLRASSPAKANLVLEWKLEKLLKESVHDCEPYSRIIHICGETRNTALATRVFESMEAQGIQLSTGVFNALITAFLSIGDLLSAMILYDTMENLKDCKPDSATYDAFMSAFSQLGSGHAMMSWYLVAKEAGFTPSIQAFESLITGFVRLNRLDDADMIFKEMSSFDIKPSIAILEAKLKVLTKRNDLGLIKDFIKSSIESGWELNESVAVRLLRLCSDGDIVDEMEQLLGLMGTGMQLSSLARVHCGIIRWYASADRLADTEHAICRMLDGGMMFMCPEDVEAVICSYFRQKEFGRLDSFLSRIRGLYSFSRSTYDILVAGYRRFELHGRLDSTITDMMAAGFA